MNKNDLKKLLVSGFAVGCITMAQGAIAHESEKTNADDALATTEKTENLDDALATTEKTENLDDALATTEKTENLENAFAGGCGGGKCGGQRTAPNNNRALTPEEEQEQIQGQGQGAGHSCAGQPRPQGRIA